MVTRFIACSCGERKDLLKEIADEEEASKVPHERIIISFFLFKI